MLTELTVENLLLIEHARLVPAPGLNVLTGETGAGKTVLAHALDLLLGGRARAGIVRPGAQDAYVEGIFDLPQGLFAECDDDLSADADELVLARRVWPDGRTRAYLNGRTTTVTRLREIGSSVISFYGQHEHRKLTLAASQLEILDRFCGLDQASRRRECATVLTRVRAAEADLVDLAESARTRERELDLLGFELQEIEAVDPDEDEHARLIARRERLSRLDALRRVCALAVDALAGESSDRPPAGQQVAEACEQLQAVRDADPVLDGLADRCRALAIDVDDLAGELRDYAISLDQDEETTPLQVVLERLTQIDRLLRRHGPTIATVRDYEARARARREELLELEVTHNDVRERLGREREILDGLVSDLRRARVLAAPVLAEAVRGQLEALAMSDATFDVDLREREVTPTGGDEVEFQIAPNPGVPAGPLREIASGGELSRVMLALATSGSGQGSGPDHADRAVTLVFDEIDAGIGGQTASAVGERLRDLGQEVQVICITHLPQIASMGDRHFAISKDTTTTTTQTTVTQLSESQVLAELVRMLGAGDDDIAARRHARALRAAA